MHLVWKLFQITIWKYFKGTQPSDKFDNPSLINPWVTNDNSVHVCALESGTCFRLLGTVRLSLYNILLKISFVTLFYNHSTTMLAISIVLQHSYCNIVLPIIQFRFIYLYFLYHIKRFYFWQLIAYKRKITLLGL